MEALATASSLENVYSIAHSFSAGLSTFSFIVVSLKLSVLLTGQTSTISL